ncbi:hypothetical protein [Absidia glauca]|uniref:Uncharacterized protein n=1 Tax=Absidia glauca TaxID=4829 RepID=A0A163JPC5_ABSGL|nr:hypothetical protein [Absidia glauca]
MDTAPINPAPTGKDRMMALQHLGCTFKEGEHDVTKIATPTVPMEGQEKETIPTFVNATEEEGEDMEIKATSQSNRQQ